MSATGAASVRWNRERMTAGRIPGSSASNAARTPDENCTGASTTRSTTKVRPASRSWVRCRCRSSIAWLTSATVLARTPPRPLSTRSTVASDRPA